MRKFGILILVFLFVATGCTPSVSNPQSSANTTTNASIQGTAKVFTPEELLSADEAAKLVGYPITIESDTLSKDTDTGIASERYRYDIDNNTIHGLVQIEQNGLKTADDLNAGNTALKSFKTEQEFSKDEITAVGGLGDEAFTFNSTGQLHMVYKDYYIVVAFDKDAYDSSKNAPLNIELGQKILTNLKGKI